MIACKYADFIRRRAETVPGGSATPSPPLHFFTITAENSGRTAGAPLFFHSPIRRRPRISAETEMAMADNLPQKQQQQRETSCAV
jgi:hypothetical protein